MRVAHHKLWQLTSFVIWGIISSSVYANDDAEETWSPKRGDICMRFFTKSRIDETLVVGHKLHINCAVWSYIQQPELINKIRTKGWSFQGTINTFTTDAKLAAHDDKGSPIKSHILGQYWADPRNTEYINHAVNDAKKWLDLGVYGLQRDDPTFGEWHHKIRYSDETLNSFHRAFREDLQKISNKPIYLTVNSDSNRPFMEEFDSRMVEIQEKAFVPSFWKKLTRSEKPYVLTLGRDMPLEQVRRIIALTYATGNVMIMPWDQFNIDAKNSNYTQRIFIDPNLISDLSDFVYVNNVFWKSLRFTENANSTGSKKIEAAGHIIENTDESSSALFLWENKNNWLLHIIRLQQADIRIKINNDYLYMNEIIYGCGPNKKRQEESSENRLQSCRPLRLKQENDYSTLTLNQDDEWLTLHLEKSATNILGR